MSKKIVSVVGNIGVGKTAFTRLARDRLGWESLSQRGDETLYLTRILGEMRRWGAHTQIFALSYRLYEYRWMLDQPTSIIQDSNAFEDAEVFVPYMHSHGEIDEKDYALFKELYERIIVSLPPPDMLVYLRASVRTLMERNQGRGLGNRRDITSDYLNDLNKLYEKWISKFVYCPVLVVPADDLDFMANKAHLELIVMKISEKIGGKDEVFFFPEEVSGIKSND